MWTSTTEICEGSLFLLLTPYLHPFLPPSFPPSFTSVLSDMVLWQSSPNANIIPSKCINNPFRTHLVCWKVEQKLLSRHSWHLIQNGMATSFIVGVKTCSDGVTSVFFFFYLRCVFLFWYVVVNILLAMLVCEASSFILPG